MHIDFRLRKIRPDRRFIGSVVSDVNEEVDRKRQAARLCLEAMSRELIGQLSGGEAASVPASDVVLLRPDSATGGHSILAGLSWKIMCKARGESV